MYPFDDKVNYRDDDEDNDLNEKAWWQSKTILINIGFALLVALQALTGAIQPLLPVDLYESVAVILPALNAFLRTISDTTIVYKE